MVGEEKIRKKEKNLLLSFSAGGTGPSDWPKRQQGGLALKERWLTGEGARVHHSTHLDELFSHAKREDKLDI